MCCHAGAAAEAGADDSDAESADDDGDSDADTSGEDDSAEATSEDDASADDDGQGADAVVQDAGANMHMASVGWGDEEKDEEMVPPPVQGRIQRICGGK